MAAYDLPRRVPSARTSLGDVGGMTVTGGGRSRSGGAAATGAGDATSLDSGRAIYGELAVHQRLEPWFGQELIALLQLWEGRFKAEFKLDIPAIVLCLEKLPRNRYAHFRHGHNGFGLRGEIAFNTLYLNGERDLWEILGTLLHELLHAWQQAHGTPGKRNHHNAEFRQKAWELGLIIDRRGVTGYRASSPFKTLLRCSGIDTPSEQFTLRPGKAKGSFKLKKWSCACRPAVNVRVAVAHFRARCLNCGSEFVRHDDGATNRVIEVPRDEAGNQ